MKKVIIPLFALMLFVITPCRLMGLNRLAVSPDMSRIAVVMPGKNCVRVFDLRGKKIRDLEGHEGAVMSLDFSTDGKRDGAIHFISADSEKVLSSCEKDYTRGRM
ncbi:MAG: hypothetical protein KBA61_00890 [Spirochaetes bacterium]|nr:hypothetical protein [Spirochaetota bacterium]